MKIIRGICATALVFGVSLCAFAQSQENQEDMDRLIAQGPGVVDLGQLGAGEGYGAADQPEGQNQAGMNPAEAEVVEPVPSVTDPSVADPSAAGTEAPEADGPLDVNRFLLPEAARMLVVVEGTTGSDCNVYAYERENGAWIQRLSVTGYLGRNGMSNNRTAGDKTTPIGVFQMNTPFGQSEPLAGFPSNYIRVDGSYVWEDSGNVLSQDPEKEGEKVGTSRYAGYYDYAIDFGYNPNAIERKGSALFLHCEGAYKGDTSGCVAIKKADMIKIMELYGKYGDGHCFSALAPAGKFHLIYRAYGVNDGLSPEGDFTKAQ